MTPGRKSEVFSSGFWWEASVQSLNELARSVTVDCWGSTQVHSFEHVRLPKVRRPWAYPGIPRIAVVAVAAALAGGVLGAILTRLLGG